MAEIYYPEEDSFLLQRIIKKINVEKNFKILDMGSGTGIQAKTFLEKGVLPENLTLVDINSSAIKLLKKKFKKSKVINSNLFKKVKGKFDIIVFNPPYLPEDKYDKEKDTTGGKKGGELINLFLIQSKKHLEKGGKIFLLISSLTKGVRFNGYKKKIVEKKKLFFEELKIFELN